jgi:hypothetical protein
MKANISFKALLALLVILFQCCFRSWGQYAINWHVIAGGGGTSTNGQLSLTATIGQAAAGGPMTGGNLQLTAGYWALLSVLQTPGAPTLHISHSASTVSVYWQNVSGWSLQQNPNLANAAAWSTNNSWTTLNGTNYLNLTSPTGNLFFRLQKQ